MEENLINIIVESKGNIIEDNVVISHLEQLK